MGNSSSEIVSPYVIRPDDISEMESCVLPEIAQLTPSEQEHMMNVLARQKEEDHGIHKHLSDLSQEVRVMKALINRKRNAGCCPLCCFSFDNPPQTCVVCGDAFCDFCCRERRLKTTRLVCLMCWKSTMLFNNSCGWESHSLPNWHGPKRTTSFCSQGSSSSSLVSASKRSRHGEAGFLGLSKTAKSIKIKIGFYVDEQQFTVKVCEAINLDCPEGSQCYVILSTLDGYQGRTYYSKVTWRCCKWSAICTLADTEKDLVVNPTPLGSVDLFINVKVICRYPNTNICIAEKFLDVGSTDLNIAKWYTLSKPDYNRRQTKSLDSTAGYSVPARRSLQSPHTVKAPTPAFRDLPVKEEEQSYQFKKTKLYRATSLKLPIGSVIGEFGTEPRKLFRCLTISASSSCSDMGASHHDLAIQKITPVRALNRSPRSVPNLQIPSFKPSPQLRCTSTDGIDNKMVVNTFGLDPKSIPFKRRRSSFIESVLREMVEPERQWREIESQLNYPCYTRHRMSVLEHNIQQRLTRRNKSVTEVKGEVTALDYRHTKSLADMTCSSYPEFSKDKVLHKSPRDVRSQKRLPPDGEEYGLTLGTLVHEQAYEEVNELGWICLSVKWGFGGRIEVLLNAFKFPKNVPRTLKMKISMKSCRREVISQTLYRIDIHGEDTHVNKKVSFNQNQLNTVLKISCKFNLWRKGEVLIPLDQADKSTLGCGAWFSLNKVPLLRIRLRKGEYEFFEHE